jgi:hypothetical protein
MATFDELVQDVYTLTNRPDLTGETALAIKAATLKAHQSDFYSKDIYETVIIPDGDPTYIHSIDYLDIVSNYRALKYLRALDSDGEPAQFITMITPEIVLDSYYVSKTDVCYVAGRVLETRTSTIVPKFIFSCYVNPIVTAVDYSSWVADLYPFTIVYEAARVVFKTIGYDEQAAQYQRLVDEQYLLLRTNALPDLGG